MGSADTISQLTALNKELKRRDEDLKDLQEIALAHESTISAKQLAIKDLDGKTASLVKDVETEKAAKSALQTEVSNLKSSLSARDREKEADAAERSKLQKALDDLREIMAAKTTEEVKLREAQRSREAEMADLRKEAAQHQRNLEDFKKSTTQAAGKLRVEVDNLRQRHSAAEKDLKTANETLRLKIAEIEKLSRTASLALKAQKTAEGERDTVAGQLKDLEMALQDVTAERKVSLKTKVY